MLRQNTVELYEEGEACPDPHSPPRALAALDILHPGPLSQGKALLLSSWAAVSRKGTYSLLWPHLPDTSRKSTAPSDQNHKRRQG